MQESSELLNLSILYESIFVLDDYDQQRKSAWETLR